MPPERNPINPTTGRRQPGRPPSLTTIDIADAVLAVSFAGLTVAAVAAHLGVNHATLYRYVTGRDELIRLAVDRLAQTTDWPPPGPDWRAYLQAQAWAFWGLLEANRGLAGILPGAAATSQPMAARLNRIGVHLLTLGFTPDGAVLAFDTVLDLVADARLHAEHLDTGLPGRRERDRLATDWTQQFDPPLQAVLRDAILANPRDWLARKLAVVLDGIEHRLAPPHHP